MIRSKPTNLIAKVLAFLACLVMVASPIVHAIPMANGDDDWVWLCTGKGYVYVNFNADNSDTSNEEPPEQPKKLGGASCCLYDAAPDAELVVFSNTEIQTQLTVFQIYRIPFGNSFTHYSPRAPPAKFS